MGKNPEADGPRELRTSRRTSEEPTLPAWIAAALPSDVTIQYVNQRIPTVCKAAARHARTT